MKDLKDKIAVITRAGGVIGRSIALALPMPACTSSWPTPAVVSLTEAMAVELAPHPFGVTIPSRVPTNLQKNSALLTAEKLGTEQRRFERAATPQAERNVTLPWTQPDR
jgi:hypothetical protein